MDREDTSATNASASFNAGDTVVEGRDAIVRDFGFINTFPLSIHVLANASIDSERRQGVVYAVAYLKTAQGRPGADAGPRTPV